MKKYVLLVVIVSVLGSFLGMLPVSAQDAAVGQDKTGQQLLDEAEELKLKAETIVQQKAVIDLLEKAIAKGLDEANGKFAKQLLVDVLYQRAERLIAQGGRFGVGPGIRDEVTAHVKRAIEIDPGFVDGYLTLARLAMQGRRDGRKEAMEWIDKAVTAAEAKEDAKEKLASVLVNRSMLRQKEEEKLADLEAALKADPKNSDALMQLAQYWGAKQDVPKATGFLQQLVDAHPDNEMAAQLLAATLLQTGKFDDAKALATKIIEANAANYTGYALRAKITDQQASGMRADEQEAERKKLYESSVADYTAALERAPATPSQIRTQLQVDRAESLLSIDKIAEARADVKAVLAAEPGNIQAILVRSFASARDKKYEEAIEDLKLVLETIDNRGDTTGLQLQLGSYYVQDKRPRKAVEIFTNLLEEGIENQELKSSTLRARADAYLAYGKHTDAIKDYEEALKIDPEDSGILNNLAWVLATSPEDKIRNGDKSVEYGLKACEITKYKASHILSTLAAGYAEKGDFENAIKWSSKAVEIGGNGENDEQLKQELEGYKQKKPWREAQETEEKKGSVKPNDRDL